MSDLWILDRHRMRLALAVFVAVVFITACGIGESTSPRAAADRHLEMAVEGEWTELWERLHPEHRRIASLSEFGHCGEQTDIQISEISIGESASETIEAPLIGSVQTRGVSLSFQHEGRDTNLVIHEIEIDDEWHWMLSQAAVEAYQSGQCPGDALPYL